MDYQIINEMLYFFNKYFSQQKKKLIENAHICCCDFSLKIVIGVNLYENKSGENECCSRKKCVQKLLIQSES